MYAGCCVVFGGKTSEIFAAFHGPIATRRLAIEDPKGRPLDEVREIRDDIARRVAELDTGSGRDAV
jgi:hypothetical protein